MIMKGNNDWNTSVSRTVEVTITVTKHGDVWFDFYEPESGDDSRIFTTMDNLNNEESRVGGELLSWAELMADEVDDLDVDDDESEVG